MPLSCLGLNHTTAPLALREQIAFNDDQARLALACLRRCGERYRLSELVILSTCNRMELYAAGPTDKPPALEAFLNETRPAALDELAPHLYRLEGAAVAWHLFRVAAGLDSLVLGEPQILGQVTRALELARSQEAAGPLLNRLFQSAIHAGKRARAETSISRNPASIPSLAAGLAERATPTLPTAHIVVLGAGEMAELTVEALRKRGAGRIAVVNRSPRRADELAARWSAQTIPFEALDQALAQADILIASTSAPHTVVEAGMVQAAMRIRPARPLTLIDIAVPRDIDPQASAIPNVQVHDIDALSAHLDRSLAERAAEAPLVEAILAEELDAFLAFLHSQEMLPLIADLRRQADAIRRAELEKTLRRLPDLSPDEQARIEALTVALVNKLLNPATQRLRAEAACPYAREYATVARTLFGVQEDQAPCAFSGQACTLR